MVENVSSSVTAATLAGVDAELKRNNDAPLSKGRGGYIYLGFFTALALCTLLAIAAFAAMRKWSDVGASDGPIADTLSAILGFSVAVSGSAVALVLAVRALRQADESNRLSEEVSRLTRFSAQLERQREVEARVGHTVKVLDGLTSAGENVTATARELFRASDVDQADLEATKPAIREAQAAASDTLDALSDAVHALWRDEILAAAWQAQAAAWRAHPAASEAGLILAHYKDLLAEFKRRESSHDLRRHDTDTSFKDMEKAHLESAWRDEEPSEWWRSSGSLPEPEHWQPSAENARELALHLRRMAAELRAADPDEIWWRIALARYASHVQNVAVFDPGQSGGYHMPPAFRLQSERFFGPTKDKEEEIRSGARLIMSTTGRGASRDPLMPLFLLSPPVFPLDPVKVTWQDYRAIREEIRKGGAFPRDRLALNHAAFVLAQVSLALPDQQYIRQAAARLAGLGADVAARLAREPLGMICQDFMRPVLSQIWRSPDKIFLPLPRDTDVDVDLGFRRNLKTDLRKVFPTEGEQGFVVRKIDTPNLPMPKFPKPKVEAPERESSLEEENGEVARQGLATLLMRKAARSFARLLEKRIVRR